MKNKFTDYYQNLMLMLESHFDEEIKNLAEYGYKLIEKKQIGNVTIFLIESPEGIYEIGLTSFDKAFTTLEIQQQKFKTNELIRFMRSFVNIVKEWISKYGEIFVGSLVEDRTYKYHRILQKYFNVSDVRHDPPQDIFPESWNFKIFSTKEG